MQCPERAQTVVGVFVFAEHLLKRTVCALGQFAVDGSALQDDARAAGVPGTGVGLVLDKPGVAEFFDVVIAALPVLGQALFRREAEDAAGVFLQHGVAADVAVMPVENKHIAGRADLHAKANPLLVVRVHEILVMLAHVAGAGRDQFIGQHRVLVDVRHENLALILVRVGIGQVDTRTAVGRAVTVIRDRANVAVDVRVEMTTGLPMVCAAGDDVPQVRDHAGADEQLPLGVVVDAPRVAEAVRDNLKHVLGRVITPNAAVDRLAFALKLDRLGIRLAVLENLAFPLRLSNHRRSEHSLAAVDPAVRPPVQAVENLVPVADAPAGQAHLDIINIGLVVLISIRDE